MGFADSTIDQLVELWLSYDKDEKTRAQIKELHQKKDVDTLEKLLRKPIQFGTAGLRSRMEAGFARMNCVTVIQASQGLAEYTEKHVENAKERGIFIGHDHRHNSDIFARHTAAVFLKRGFKVYLYQGLTHTPLTPFGVRRNNAACGVMITASHNPKEDNGYKVYWENGAQIIPPHDSGIAACIAQNQEPKLWDTEYAIAHPKCIDVTDEMKKEYAALGNKMVLDREANAQSTLRYVYTAMHGVGAPFVKTMLAAMSLPEYIPVPVQDGPNPDFPSVAFPNPEEKGALDLAKQTADEAGVSLVLANDPDADRFAAAEKQADGTWFVFTGDQLGSIFAKISLDNAVAQGVPVEKAALVNSTVSSRMLAKIAEVEGCMYRDTLTGFKWMSNCLLDLARDEKAHITFGYEEAIGYLVNSAVMDKDGVTALGMFVQHASKLYASGTNMKQYLDSLYKKYGYFVSDNAYYICHDPILTSKIFNKMRFGPPAGEVDPLPRTNFQLANGKVLRYPLTIGGSPVTYIRDLTVGFEVSNMDKLVAAAGNAPIVVKEGEYYPTFMVSASSEMITFSTANGARVTLRTSGTEPKIKYYTEFSGPENDRPAVHASLKQFVQGVSDDVMRAKQNGLL